MSHDPPAYLPQANIAEDNLQSDPQNEPPPRPNLSGAVQRSSTMSTLPPLPPASPTRSHSMSPTRTRAPTLIPHNSRSIVLPTPEILGSVAGGAHYAGAFAAHGKHVHPAHLEKHRRSMSLSADDPLVSQAYKDVMLDLQELFCGRPTLEIFERRWRPDAEFEDPLCKCIGFNEYASQFFALPKICLHSERLASRILSATFKPNRLVFSQTQEYTFRWIGSKKIVSSFVLVDLDENFKIIRLVVQWNGEDPPTRWGALLLRKLSAKIVPWFVHVPRYPTSTFNSTAAM